jgi:hypothetical protein
MVQDPQWRSSTAEGYEEIAQACILLEAPGDPKDRLRKAGALFWRALRHSHTWPELLRSESAALIAKLFRYGPVDRTIDRFNDQQLAEATEQLAVFCREFLDWDRKHSRKSDDRK